MLEFSLGFLGRISGKVAVPFSKIYKIFHRENIEEGFTPSSGRVFEKKESFSVKVFLKKFIGNSLKELME